MEVHRLRLTGTQGTQEEKPTQKKEGLELVYVFHSDLDLEAAAESEPAVPPGRGPRRRRRRPAQHLPHHVHVLVLARAHLLPQPPQPCKESKSDAGVRPSPPGSITRRNGRPHPHHGRGCLTGLANPKAGRDAEPDAPHRQPPVTHRSPRRRTQQSPDRARVGEIPETTTTRPVAKQRRTRLLLPTII
jgi:hypothetical protein